MISEQREKNRKLKYLNITDLWLTENVDTQSRIRRILIRTWTLHGLTFGLKKSVLASILYFALYACI